MSRPDWHGLVGVTRSLYAAICRAHRLHGPDAQSWAARMTRTAISRRFEENLGNRNRRGSHLKVVQWLPRHRRVLVFDLEQDTWLFGDDGRKGLHDLDQADCVADGHRVTRALKPISPGAGRTERWLDCLSRYETIHLSDCSGTRVAGRFRRSQGRWFHDGQRGRRPLYRSCFD